MATSRDKRFRNTEHLQTVMAVAVLAVISALVVWMALRSPEAVDRTSATECAALYARASTAADSATVDGYRPRTTKAGSSELRCGALRSLGRSR